jgi:trehalose utilization protein
MGYAPKILPGSKVQKKIFERLRKGSEEKAAVLAEGISESTYYRYYEQWRLQKEPYYEVVTQWLQAQAIFRSDAAIALAKDKVFKYKLMQHQDPEYYSDKNKVQHDHNVEVRTAVVVLPPNERDNDTANLTTGQGSNRLPTKGTTDKST